MCMEYDEIAQQLEQAVADDFIGFEIGRAMAYPLINYRKSKKLALAVLLHPIRYGGYTAEGTGKIAFFWGGDYSSRADHWNKFEQCEKLLGEPVLIKERPSVRLATVHALCIWRVIRWWAKMRTLKVSATEKWYLAAMLYQIYCELLDLDKMQLKAQINLLVAFCDAQKSDTIAVQYFKKTGIKTATLEHGYYDPNFILERLAYRNSLSDYFLCFGPVSKKHGVEQGLPEEKMISLGMLENIQDANIRSDIQNTKQFGVALTYGTYDDENELILDIANELAHSCGITYIVRPHPHLKAEKYQCFIDSSVGKVAPIGQSIVDFEDNIDFCLLGNSAMFISMLYKRIPTYRCGEEGKPDKFSDILWCRCKSKEEAISLYRYMKQRPASFMKQLDETRNAYFATGIVADNYREFLSQFK